MGKFVPVFVAFALNSYGLYIFRTPQNFDSFPYMSYLIFLLSMFVLLLDICFYATSFRRLYFWAEFILEFLSAMFIMEIIMNDFWLPLENAFIDAIPKVADFISTQTAANNLKFDLLDQLCNTIKSQDGLYVASYALSIFFLLSILHATRIVDFRILKCDGPLEFINESTCRAKMFIKGVTKQRMRSNKCRRASGTKPCLQPGPSRNNNDSGDSD